MLVFNLDFLHPRDQQDADLFCDHIEFPIPINDYDTERAAMVSIAVPEASVIFNGLLVEFEVAGTLPSGEKISAPIPLMNELGLVVTKSKSFTHEKRPRDLFDIYLSIKQARDPAEMIESARQLRSYDAGAFHCITGLRDSLIESPGLEKNIRKYLPTHEPSDDLLAPIRDFVRSVGIAWDS